MLVKPLLVVDDRKLISPFLNTQALPDLPVLPHTEHMWFYLQEELDPGTRTPLGLCQALSFLFACQIHSSMVWLSLGVSSLFSQSHITRNNTSLSLLTPVR